MSVTRLLILGAVRIFQPTHGYFVRRELTSWQAADWAHLNPGSIYNALRALTKERMLLEEHDPDVTAKSSRSRTLYRLTLDGEQEFQRLVRESLWELHPYEPGWLNAGASFWFTLGRDEVVAALEARASLLSARISGTSYAAAGFPHSAVGTPAHVIEHFLLHEAQLGAELEWARAAAERIRRGAYGFLGEDPTRLVPVAGPGRPAPAADEPAAPLRLSPDQPSP